MARERAPRVVAFWVKMEHMTFALSMLDLVAVREGHGVGSALQLARRTAQHAESLGFVRYWMAEHHNLAGVASSATAVLVGHVAQGTQRIRVGSGGIMLPNHAPLVVAEAFGTLAELYPGRIDLGLGRAPGTDPTTMRALRRDRVESESDFPRDVLELQQLLGDVQPGQRVRALPGAGTHVPIWLLGSSLFSAQLAAQLGMPFAFASHFAPRYLMQALQVYRSGYQPSARWPKPHVVIGVPLVAADSDEQADFLATSVYQRFVGILRGDRRALQPPVAGYLQTLQPQELAGLQDFLGAAAVGGPETVGQRLHELQQLTQADELMLVCDIYDPEARLHALTLAAQAVAASGHALPQAA